MTFALRLTYSPPPDISPARTISLPPQTFPAVNPLIATLRPQSNRPSCSNTVICTLAVNGWAVTFGTGRRGLGGTAARPDPSSMYQM